MRLRNIVDRPMIQPQLADDATSHLRNVQQTIQLIEEELRLGGIGDKLAGDFRGYLLEANGRIAAALALMNPPRTVERPMGAPA